MRRYLLILSIGFMLFFMVSATQVRADGVDTFTFNETDFAGSEQTLTLIWQLPSSPSGVSVFSLGSGFQTPDPVSVTVTLGGLTQTISDTFVFFNSNLGGGFIEGNGIYFTTGDSSQFYTGLENAPTFTLGTFSGIDSGFDGEATLSVASPSIATPEPSAFLLLAAALAVFLISATLKKQIL
jgi:hypothetical protein